MKRSMQIGLGLVLTVGVLFALKVLAETEAINPTEIVTRGIRLTGSTPLTINGTAVTATAAQLNAAGGGSTAAITPTTVLVSSTLGVNGKTTLTGGLGGTGWVVTNTFGAGVYTQRLFYAVGNVITNVTVLP